MTFASPGNTSSESVKVAELDNHLLIITPIEYKIKKRIADSNGELEKKVVTIKLKV